MQSHEYSEVVRSPARVRPLTAGPADSFLVAYSDFYQTSFIVLGVVFVLAAKLGKCPREPRRDCHFRD